VTQDRARPARLDGGEPPPEFGEHCVPDRVDTSVNAVQLALCAPPANRRRAQADRDQIGVIDNAVLAAGHRSHRLMG
jgi:hypothetical protein